MIKRRASTNYYFILTILAIFSFVSLAYTFYGNNIYKKKYISIRGIEYRTVLYRTRGFNKIETEHFVIRYKKIDEDLLQWIAYTAEEKYKHTSDIFKYQPKKKILMIVYDHPQEMMNATTLRKGDPPMGVYYGDSIHILDPSLWVENKEYIKENFYSQGPVLHELVHLFTDHVGIGNFPMWFTEGVSLYFEYLIDDYEWGKDIILDEEKYTLDKLTYSFYQLDTFEAYTKCFRLIKNFTQKYGIDELMQLIRELSEGKNLKESYHLFF